MNPPVMLSLILGLHLVFAFSAWQRWDLLRVGRFEPRFDRLGERLEGVIKYAFAQKKMHYYPLAGLAHHLIFGGFMVLLARTLILWGRGIYPAWNLIIFSPENPLGMIYELAKDTVAVLVLGGACTFVYLRGVKKTRRMTMSNEAYLILGIIITMMLTDIMYDGATLALHSRWGSLGCIETIGRLNDTCSSVQTIIAPLPKPHHGEAGMVFHWYAPAGSIASLVLQALPTSALVVVAHLGFWVHSSLVLIFMNILPYSKHFHIITAIPNVFFRNLDSPGRLPVMAESSEKLMEQVSAASEKADMLEDPIGVARIEHFTWKAISDFYTCTECGRCSDNCPAHKTGKMLSPKQFTLNLRNHLYARGDELTKQYVDPLGLWRDESPKAPVTDGESDGSSSDSSEEPAEGALPKYQPVDLVGQVIHPDVLWGCTSCRACEEQCPVMISYVDKIVSMRRNLVTVKGEFPAELQKPFNGIETNGNPWNLSSMDRAGWAEGLNVKTMTENPTTKVLYWVGCAASYDDRAKKIARATVRLLQEAGIDFAILGEEESCTGDPARRAGNEYLFLTQAEKNTATLNGYKEQGGIKTILTTCPHCFNTLANEYPDFGAKFEVVHHTDYLLGLLAQGKLKPKNGVKGRVVFHDSCYLGRYNDIYESPREILKRIPGVELVEPENFTRNKGLCCGAGGAQMFMEEQNKDRVNVKRTLQLLDTKASTIASACPFCMTMLTDGIKSKELENEVKQLDVVELLATSCVGDEA